MDWIVWEGRTEEEWNGTVAFSLLLIYETTTDHIVFSRVRENAA